jgi:hypothetical protein
MAAASSSKGMDTLLKRHNSRRALPTNNNGSGNGNGNGNGSVMSIDETGLHVNHQSGHIQHVYSSHNVLTTSSVDVLDEDANSSTAGSSKSSKSASSPSPATNSSSVYVHTYETEEAEAFALYINDLLKDDIYVQHLLPLDPASNEVFTKHSDGLIMLRLLENAVPGCLNGKRFTAHNSETGTPMNVFRRNENLNLFLKLAAEERCHLINIGANDISSGK